MTSTTGESYGDPRPRILLMIEREEPEQLILEELSNLYAAMRKQTFPEPSKDPSNPWPLDTFIGVDLTGCTALHYAAIWGADDVLKSLLDHHANPDCCTTDSLEFDGLHTPMEFAAWYGREDVVLQLLRAQHWEDSKMKSALISGAKRGSWALDELLVKRFDESGDEIRYSTPTMFQAMYAAVKHNQMSALQVLVEYEPSNLTAIIDESMEFVVRQVKDGDNEDDDDEERNVPGTVGESLLLLAVHNDFNEMAAFLVTLGADPGLGPLIKAELHVNGKEAIHHAFGAALVHKKFEAATNMLCAGFLTSPGTALYATMCVSEAAVREERRVHIINPPLARKLLQQSHEAQLLGLQMLQTLTDVRQRDLLRSIEGESFVRLAAQMDSIVVLSQPVLQEDMQTRWYGGVGVAVLLGKGTSMWGDVIQLSPFVRLKITLYLVFLILPMNLVLMVVVAIHPAMELRITEFLGSLGENGERWGFLQETGYNQALWMWWDELWLLGVPGFKAMFAHISNLTYAGLLVCWTDFPKEYALGWAVGNVLTQASYLTKFLDQLHSDEDGRPPLTKFAWLLLVSGSLLSVSAVIELISDEGENEALFKGFSAFGVLLLMAGSLAQIFMQSVFFGPMVVSVIQMMSDMLQWLGMLAAFLLSFTAAYWVNMAGQSDEDQEPLAEVVRWFFSMGLKFSPLTGTRPLAQQDEHDPVEYMLIRLYGSLVSVMLFSILTAIFSTRLMRDDKSRVPTFQREFSKLVITEHFKLPAPPPLAGLGLVSGLISAAQQAWSGTSQDAMDFKDLRSKAQAASELSQHTKRKHRSRIESSDKLKSDKLKRMKTQTALTKKEALSTPDKLWHNVDYMRDNPPRVFLKRMLQGIEKERLKQEGPLSASTAHSKLNKLSSKVDEFESSIQERVDAIALSVRQYGRTSAQGASPQSHRSSVAALSQRGNFGLSKRVEAVADAEDPVQVYRGFVERAYRILFPYGKYAHLFNQNKDVRHMTILDNGVIENEVNRLYIGGKFTDEDRKDLKALSLKALEKMLKSRIEKGQVEAKECKDKLEYIDALMGTDRELDLTERSLIAFPFLQTMGERAARKHIAVGPNSDFVRHRADGTYGVSHCWPVKYNDAFMKKFKCSTTNPDLSKFSPRKAHEFRECMARLFGPLPADCQLVYATSAMTNETRALVGTVEQLVEFLRARPQIMAEMKIKKLYPDGFKATVDVPKKPPSEKLFKMAPDGRQQVIYVKKGYETMASCKPLDLFHKDCEFLEGQVRIPKAVNAKLLRSSQHPAEKNLLHA